PSGVAAAISAARAGANTYLVERYNHLGGLWTGGLVLPLLSTHAVNKDGKTIKVIHGIGGEVSERLRKMDMTIKEINPTIDAEAAKYVLDEMIAEAGVKMVYHALGTQVIMDGNTIKGVFIESKSGRQALLGKVVIDCTGDGDIFHFAGEKYDEMLYHIGLVHRLGNTDRINTKATGYKEMGVGEPTPIKGVNWVNMHGEDEQCATDVMNLTRLQMKYRKEIWENTQKVRATPGYEDIFLLETAPQIGTRASRIVEGEYCLTLEDSMTYKNFGNDAIGVSGAWTTMVYNGRRVAAANRPYWQIPLKSLIPKTTDGLIVAGRCFSFERALVEDTRVIGTCLITGHGAGAAAALAAQSGERPRDIDREKLQKILKDQNVWMG
ncbi:MAG: FAD-dependent oxidoreductase, partial [Rikenellaceae bacterium]